MASSFFQPTKEEIRALKIAADELKIRKQFHAANANIAKHLGEQAPESCKGALKKYESIEFAMKIISEMVK